MENNIVKNILDIAPANVHDLDGVKYTDKQLYKLPYLSKASKNPSLLSLSTISGMLELLKKETKQITVDHKTIFVIVVSPHEINVTTTFRPNDIEVDKNTFLPYGERPSLYIIRYKLPQISLNAFMPSDKAIIQLNALFEKTEERDELLAAISSIDRTDDNCIEDNGVSQTVTAKSGIALKSRAPFKPIWKLKPYRSFIEAPLAETPFLIRINESFQIGLFECDGGKWENDAKSNIVKHIEDKLFDFPKDISGNIVVLS